MYRFAGVISELPVFWEAQTISGYLRQIDDNGIIAHHYSELLENEVIYYGLVTAHGKFGFSREKNTFVIDDIHKDVGLLYGDSERSQIENPLLGTLSYRRSVICNPSINWQITKLVEIKLGKCVLCVRLFPEFLVNMNIVSS